MSGRLIAVAVAVLLALPLSVQGQAPSPPSRSTTPDLSGFWELSFDGRKVPRANLLPAVTEAVIAERAMRDAHAVRWCNVLGLPFSMDNGRPLDVRQGATAIIITSEVQTAPPRYLYLNRAEHVSADVFDPTTSGDSVARWDGDTLIVDTIGFHPDRGITAIPGGGFRTERSRLSERYRLIENGSVLSITFTWTDPGVFRAPHTYEYRYSRLPADYEARTWIACDPYNETRVRFLEG